MVVHLVGRSRHLLLLLVRPRNGGIGRRPSSGPRLPVFLAGRLTALFRERSVGVAKNCLAQLEYVLADRVRRAQQMFSLYSRLWGEVAIRRMIDGLRCRLVTGGKELLVAVAALSVFSWDDERIPDEEFEKHKNELAICKKLRAELKNGPKSKNGSKSEKNADTTERQCPCPSCGSSVVGCCWDTFIDGEDLSVWKMEEPNHKGSGLYCYKIFGRYEDVTADDFFSVFVDLVRRKDWDSHVVSLYVIDTEPETNSDVIYWETKWPVLYSNRDYVYKRRYKIDRENKLMTILNKSAEHPTIPLYSNKTRISEYWSSMVIRPLTDFEKPGIEFSLTYFDNPGAALPTAITLWISATGMPEYLRNLRRAAMERSRERSLNREQEQQQQEQEQEEQREEEEASRRPPTEPPPLVTPSTPASTAGVVEKTPERLAPLAAYVHWARSFL